MDKVNKLTSNKSLIWHMSNYIPTSEEIKFKEDMINFFIDNRLAFYRENASGHFTASAWVINRSNTRALITHHKKLKLKLQLGGHCDGDPDLIRVALKEIIEESGIEEISYSTNVFDIDIHVIPEREEVKEHLHYDVRFLFIVPDDAKYVVSDESDNLEWITKDYDVSNTTYGFQRMFNKWINIDLDDYIFIPL